MHIVHIITRLILGGAQENTLITCRELTQRGYNVTLITGPALGPEGALFEQTQNAGYRVIVVEALRRAILPWHDISAYLALKKHLQVLTPDIVHTHSAKAGIIGRWTAWSLKGTFAGKPVDYPKIVHTIHGLPFHPYQAAMINRFYIAIERAAAQRTDAFISVADAMTEKAHAAGIGLDKPFVTAYSAIDLQDYLTPPSENQIRQFRQRYGIADSAVVLICVARLAKLKGHYFLIEAAHLLAKRYPHCRWLLVGDGVLRKTLQAEIKQKKLEDKFIFTGLLPPSQIPLALYASDILVHCSLREGLARVLPQAMLCGKPVISFDIDGAKEVVNENTGILIPPCQIPLLVKACAMLIENPDLRKQLGQTGQQLAAARFAPSVMVDTIEEVYRRLTCPPRNLIS